MVIIGGGVVGANAAKVSLGMGANVTILERSITKMRQLDDLFQGSVKTIYSNTGNTANLIKDADLLIGAVLVPGATAPKLVSRDQLSSMRDGAAIVDVAIDQGGCFETSKATTHEDPIYKVDGVMHYCVANMPGAVARTSTIALGNATMPFIIALANQGWREACKGNPHLLNGLNVHNGVLTYDAVGNPAVSMQMNGKGSRIWENLTGNAFKQSSNIAIVLDDIVYSAPGVTKGAISVSYTHLTLPTKA